MTYNEIIKSLECCSSQTRCDECCYESSCHREMNNDLINDVAGLVNRQSVEINMLKNELRDMQLLIISYRHAIEMLKLKEKINNEP